jgi:putative copper export protein
MMSSGLRKFVLTLHITCSVGWIGAVIAFLALVIAAMTREDVQILQAVWIALDLLGSLVIIPLAIVSLLSGLVMSLGTKWGLFKHYWVLFSFALTVLAILVLLGNMQSVKYLAGIVKDMDNSNVDMLRVGLQSELLHAGIGLIVLVVIQVLNVYKPRGLTSYGWRKQQEQRAIRYAIDQEKEM